MNAPLYKYGVFGDEASLVVAFLVGTSSTRPRRLQAIDAMMEAQKDLVDVVHTLRQVVCEGLGGGRGHSSSGVQQRGYDVAGARARAGGA